MIPTIHSLGLICMFLTTSYCLGIVGHWALNKISGCGPTKHKHTQRRNGGGS